MPDEEGSCWIGIAFGVFDARYLYCCVGRGWPLWVDVTGAGDTVLRSTDRGCLFWTFSVAYKLSPRGVCLSLCLQRENKKYCSRF